MKFDQCASSSPKVSIQAQSKVRILVSGEDALIVEYGDGIDPVINDHVYGLADAIDAFGNDSILELIPTYRSLLVHYDSQVSSPNEMIEFLGALITETNNSSDGTEKTLRRVYELPVVYGGAHGQDLEDVANHAGMTPADVIAIQSGSDYRVYMLGFAPGFPYLGGMDDRIAIPRLTTPRVRVPAGSVGIAGSQTGVYPKASPGGWRLIGNTPVSLFNPEVNPPVPFLPGSFIRFNPITEEDAERVSEQVTSREYKVKMIELKS